MDKLHDDVEHAADVSEIVDSNQVGVIEAGHCLGFGLKRGPELGVRPELRGEDLDRHRAVERFLASLVNRSHSSLGAVGIDVLGGNESSEFLHGWGHKGGGFRGILSHDKRF